MADPVLRASWSSPTSVTLDIEYSSSGDIEIWSKNSTPQSQDYIKIGITTGRSYTVTDLNWSTTYFFKVRGVAGTSFTGFSNEITLFCACGQVYVENSPPVGSPPQPILVTEYWQQAADPYGDDIAFTFRDFPDHYFLYMMERTSYFDVLNPTTELNDWLFRFKSDYIESEAPGGLTPTPSPGYWDNTGTFFPPAVRNENGLIAIMDGVWWGSDYFGYYWFRLWDGENLYSRHLGTDWWYDYYNEDYYTEWTPAFRSLPYSMEFDGAGKIVAVLLFLDWYGRIDPVFFGMVLQVLESNDRGRSWSSVTIEFPRDNIEELQQATIARAGDGSYWISSVSFDKGSVPSWFLQDSSPIYKIFKYQSSGIEYAQVMDDGDNTEEYFRVNIARMITTDDPEPFVGQTIRFITGALAGEEREITGYEYKSTGYDGYNLYFITVGTPFDEIPADGDEFNIIGAEARGATLVRTIATNLYNEWGPPPNYTQTGWDINCRSCVIATEGNKIAIAYNYDMNMLLGSPNYTGIVSVKVDVSEDNGETWITNDVYIPGENIHWNLQWTSLLPTITISNGNLIMYLVEGTTVPNGYRIIKSTDNGATWQTKYDFSGVDPLIYHWVYQLRSDGDHITLTGCKAAQSTDGDLALWESLDGGETWVGEDVIPVVPTTVLAAGGAT